MRGLFNYRYLIFRTYILLFFLIIGFISCIRKEENPDESWIFPNSHLQEVEFTQVRIQDDFWYPKIKKVQDITIPHLLHIAEKEGKIDNFRIIAGLKEGKITLHNAPDSDIYKLIEAAAYSLATIKNPVFETRIDSLIEIIAAAQQPDGYLNTQYTLSDDHPSSPDLNVLHARRFGYGEKDRWNSTLDRWPYAYSQLYCFGHLMEAAVAWYRVTGKNNLLDVAKKMAAHLQENFPIEKIKSYADHPQVEIGLMKLFEISTDPQYLDLAEKFTRYTSFARPRDIMLEESSKPLAEQREAWSHAVRTAYVYSAATDIIRAKDATDLDTAIHSIWKNLTGRKMYIHGGTGNGTKFEQHGHDYDLPILNTYSESCANIAQGQWNHRLNLLSGDSKYADIVEIESYNAALAGYGEDGKTFLYSNKLNIDTTNRLDYHSGVRTSYLFCCPSKLPGFIAGINRWIYAKDESYLYINLFIGSKVETYLRNELVAITQTTNYPWEGKILLEFDQSLQKGKGIKIRIPSWNSGNLPIPEAPYYFDDLPVPGFSLSINSNPQDIKTENIFDGYYVLSGNFKKGDQIEISFNMPVRRVYTDPLVKANLGRVAIMKGPLLYSLEGVDNDFDVLRMVLPSSSIISSYYNPDRNIGKIVLKGIGVIDEKETDFIAIPYFQWQNRGIHQLNTLIIEDPEKIQSELHEHGEINTDG